ncbi:hypothetical protein LOZ53_000734 [Ophidiomyces ophidiicola]|uniref:Uncharacterized protein n=1 Tax=Ophidiomyces ophidiicola TaxID=1387563 RepID=A0ACB8V4V1_9EURO|nr:uncharacterized protein LOZ57_003449 [Ophidiomyces ophidiicola]KAI1915405.1 hypothetical protein LOZ61_001598 [Ophidiomyces ophidiicola]KAI1926020.1 hypothetical protein LOZ64_000336 [Ophidiomyces ophidiicola]KAI1929844.1 hypothetical protein LOZ60_001311 [Ophidiomyces ophidiicola]KAI1937180.1 hypothetical protein LOZ66_004097 [Ophidiomyces ophidiicola]KAI1947210.1 hypothetical protein LOZ57_003449 [Ophidiomyces ophidiicola]
MYTYTETNKFLVLLPQAHAVAPLELGMPSKAADPSAESSIDESQAVEAIPVTSKSHRSPSTGASIASDDSALSCGFLKLGL